MGAATRIYVAVGATDMRKGFNGLEGLVRERLACDPTSGHIFLFANARRDRLVQASFPEVLARQTGAMPPDFSQRIAMLWGIPRIHDRHACHVEIAAVARDDCKTVLQGSCGKEEVWM
jgi:hypothetical protein